MKRKLPLVIASTNCLSGVTSWADQLRAVLTDHPRFKPCTLHVGSEPAGNFDIAVPTLNDAHSTICAMAPAVVIPNYVWSLFLTGLEPGIRCVGMCHADNFEQYYRPLSWYEPAIAKFIGVSKECQENLIRHIPERVNDIAMLPYGVHVPTVLNRSYQTNPIRLIYAGRVTQPQKRVWDFIPLIEELLRSKTRFVFDIVGEGDEFAPLQQVIRARIPAADVHFHPRVPHCEMAAKWLNHDIFIQVSDFEGTSVSMLEAMAHGVVPVVTAASSGIAGVISPRENGCVVSVGDMPAMARAITELSKNQSQLANLGRAAYHTAKTYSMDLYAKKFARILDTVLEVDEHIDHHKRYGIYSPTHPLFEQRQLMQRQEDAEQSVQRRFGKLGKLWKRGLNGLRRANPKRRSGRDRRAA